LYVLTDRALQWQSLNANAIVTCKDVSEEEYQCKYISLIVVGYIDDRPTSNLENFKWRYLGNGSSDPLQVRSIG